MEILEVNGFKMTQTRNGMSLLIESDRLNDCLDYAVTSHITSIALLEYYGYKLPNIEFLKKHNSFTDVWVKNYLSKIDISGIHYLNNIEYLNISNGKQGIDFAHFPKLISASVDWNTKLKGFESCIHLSELIFWKYRPKSGAMDELMNMHSLTSLKITESNITSLEGIEQLTGLANFEAYFLSKLESLTGIESINNTLKSLTLDNCKKLNSYGHVLAKLDCLERLILGNCGELADLMFVAKMKSLKSFTFVDTNIKNGDLTPLLEKKYDYLGFDDKRHYSHKMRDLMPDFHWKN